MRRGQGPPILRHPLHLALRPTVQHIHPTTKRLRIRLILLLVRRIPLRKLIRHNCRSSSPRIDRMPPMRIKSAMIVIGMSRTTGMQIVSLPISQRRNLPAHLQDPVLPHNTLNLPQIRLEPFPSHHVELRPSRPPQLLRPRLKPMQIRSPLREIHHLHRVPSQLLRQIHQQGMKYSHLQIGTLERSEPQTENHRTTH